MSGIERDRKSAKAWLAAKERGEVRPLTLDDLRAAMAARQARRAASRVKQVAPYVFVVTRKRRP